MRRSPFDARRSATMSLIIAITVAFIAQLIVVKASTFSILDYLALSLDGLKHGYVWQLLTFQFLHNGWLHLLFNCLTIYFFGRELEESLGRKSFLTLYFTSGVIGGVLQEIAGVLFPQFSGPVLGASAGAFGLIAAFVTLYPDRPVMLLLIPISFPAKFLLLGSVIVAILGILGVAFTGNIAHVAHLGGMIAGVIFVRYGIHWNIRWPRLQRTGRLQPRRLVKVPSQKSALWRGKAEPPEELSADEFLSKQVDPILDKISAHGIQSLTDRERKILEKARERMGKR
jgi:membrane associated rhomboid family serine protease